LGAVAAVAGEERSLLVSRSCPSWGSIRIHTDLLTLSVVLHLVPVSSLDRGLLELDAFNASLSREGGNSPFDPLSNSSALIYVRPKVILLVTNDLKLMANDLALLHVFSRLHLHTSLPTHSPLSPLGRDPSPVPSPLLLSTHVTSPAFSPTSMPLPSTSPRRSRTWRTPPPPLEATTPPQFCKPTCPPSTSPIRSSILFQSRSLPSTKATCLGRSLRPATLPPLLQSLLCIDLSFPLPLAKHLWHRPPIHLPTYQSLSDLPTSTTRPSPVPLSRPSHGFLLSRHPPLFLPRAETKKPASKSH
jgi:hypothetical protein